MQPTANFRKKWRGTYFRRGTYLRGFTVFHARSVLYRNLPVWIDRLVNATSVREIVQALVHSPGLFFFTPVTLFSGIRNLVVKLSPWDKNKSHLSEWCCATSKINYQAWMPYILCVYGPNIVALGARCPQPSSNRSSTSISYFGRHPSWCRSNTFQFFTLKPLNFGSMQVSLFNLLLEDIPKIHDRTKLWDCKRVHLYAGGAQEGCFGQFFFDMPSLASVQALG